MKIARRDLRRGRRVTGVPTATWVAQPTRVDEFRGILQVATMAAVKFSLSLLPMCVHM